MNLNAQHFLLEAQMTIKFLKKEITVVVVAHKNDFDELADNIIQL